MRYLFIFSLLILISCKPAEANLTAQQIIDKTIVFSGVDKVVNSEITFKFRDIQYAAIRKNESFKLQRYFIKDSIAIVDGLTNNGYERLENTKELKLQTL